MENDILAYDTPTKPVPKKTPVATSPLNLSSLKYFLRDRSAAYFFTTSLIHKNAILKKLSIKIGLITPNLAILSNQAFNEKIIINSAKRLKRLSEEFNSLILIIPSRALWTGSEKQKIIADKTHAFFLSEIKRLKIKFVDMRAELKKSDKPMAFHFKHDGHWTATAHRLAAKKLAKKLNSIVTTK